MPARLSYLAVDHRLDRLSAATLFGLLICSKSSTKASICGFRSFSLTPLLLRNILATVLPKMMSLGISSRARSRVARKPWMSAWKSERKSSAVASAAVSDEATLEGQIPYLKGCQGRLRLGSTRPRGARRGGKIFGSILNWL